MRNWTILFSLRTKEGEIVGDTYTCPAVNSVMAWDNFHDFLEDMYPGCKVEQADLVCVN